MTHREQKAHLRRRLREEREALDPALRARAADAICRALCDSEAYRRCRVLLCYYPVGSEVDLHPLFARAHADGKQLAFPRCEGDELAFYFVTDPDAMPPARFRIPAPGQGAEPVCDLSQALLVAPALTADERGYRLGYGGGYYDRFLARHLVPCVCVIYDALFTDRLVHEPLDRRVDLVITEHRRMECYEA